MVCGATTFREFVDMLREERPEALDGWVSRMWSAPATVVSSTLDGLQDRPDVAVERGDAVETRTRDGRMQELVYRPHAR